MGFLKPAERVGKRYQAPVPTRVGGPSIMLKVLPQLLFHRQQRAPRVAPGPFLTDPSVYMTEPGCGLRVTWFGHSSLLLEQDGVRVLLDPVWDERAAPLRWLGPKRFFPPTIALGALPELDAVLLSHDHYDHLGAGTVRALARLRPGLRWVVPLGVGAVVRGFGVAAECVTELNWTETAVVEARGARLEVVAVPARHFSGRSPWNRNQTLWTAYVLRSAAHTVYCGADTGLWPGLAEIAERFGPFDLTLLEIGAFNELWKDIHLGPDGALQAFRELGGGVLMPIHWGLFNLALHAWRQPIERTLKLAAEQGVTLFSPRPGMPTEVCGAAVVSDWWKPDQGG